MNTLELKAEIARNGDTGMRLAKALGCSQQTLSRKLNNKGSEFNQKEINAIRTRYNLSYDRIGVIFFDN